MTGKIAEITPERSKELDAWVIKSFNQLNNIYPKFLELITQKSLVTKDDSFGDYRHALTHTYEPIKNSKITIQIEYCVNINDQFIFMIHENNSGKKSTEHVTDVLFHKAAFKAISKLVDLYTDQFGTKGKNYLIFFKIYEAYRTWVNEHALAIKQHELPGITKDLPQSLPVITDELPEVKEVNYNELPYDEKLKHICYAINPNYPELIDDLDWVKPENMRIFPFEHFTNFEVKEMKMVCDGCGEAFEGNGNYDTAYFVHHAPNDVKIYHSLRHCYPNYLTAPIDYHDQLHGYLLPVKFPKKFTESKVHRFVWSYLKGSAYELNAFVPNGFNTIEECKKAIYHLDGDGGGSSIDSGVGRHKGMKLEWSKGFASPKPEITLKPSDTLKIVNEILAACEPQSPLIDYVVLDAPTPNKEIQEIETENRSAVSIPQWKFSKEEATNLYIKAQGEQMATEVLNPFFMNSKLDEAIPFHFSDEVEMCCTFCDNIIQPNQASWLLNNNSYLFYIYCNNADCGGKDRIKPFNNTSPKTEIETESKQPNELAAPGTNFRERYNNKKMRNRLIKQLEEMPADRRAYLIESIQQHFTTAI